MIDKPVIVGHAIKSFGKAGQIRINVKDVFIAEVLKSKYLLVEVEGIIIPYFIENFDTERELIKFEGIKGPDQAKHLSDSRLYLLERNLSKKTIAESLVYQENALIGFVLFDQHQTLVGPIVEVIETPMQILLEIDHEGVKKLIPFHESLLLNLDPDSKQIHLEVSPGLLDI